MTMKNYLSFGGGINSVALYLLMMELDIEFEAIFVDHGTDWPETYEYVEMFRGKFPLTVVKPSVSIGDGGNNRVSSVYDFAWHYKIFPNRIMRWCTKNFKVAIVEKYQKTPCFVHIGFDFGESHRAKLVSERGREYRYLLIEHEINRQGCVDLIKKHGMPIPIKSGCFICPFQSDRDIFKLREKHPDLFCKLAQLENRCNEHRAKNLGKAPYYNFFSGKLSVSDGIQLDINRSDSRFFTKRDYPPCECWL